MNSLASVCGLELSVGKIDRELDKLIVTAEVASKSPFGLLPL
jgi:hypothetical protein